MFEKNTKQINQLMVDIYVKCSAVILILVLFSMIGIFEFGMKYTLIVLVAGLWVSLTPKLLIRFLSPDVLKYYMLISAAIFIGVIGTDNHVGVYITYILVPLLSCLYFDPKFVWKIGIVSYIVMIASVYVGSENMLEVVYQGRSRAYIFFAYSMGFTIEFFVATTVLYYLVKRAKQLMLERYSAEEQNQMKTLFLSNMSHEIRTPMNAIIGLSEVSLHMEMDEQLRKNVSIIHSSATSLLEIINDILDFSKIEAGKMEIYSESYSTKEMIHDMMAIIDARNDGEVPIYYHIAEDMPPILEGDAGRIRQVMLNYASNAIKYTDSGRIDISMCCERTKENVENEVNLIYTVKDTGQGIHKEDLDKLFTMYGQVNQKLNQGKEGTGIGLAISKSFVSRMGGTVSVESEYGVGSSFSFCIPQKIGEEKLEAADAITEKIEIPEGPFQTKGVRLLLVDDNEINREVAKAILEPLELTIEEAENGKEALELTENNTYDVILMDSHMPVLSGEEATKEIRERETVTGQHVPIIALTADAINGVREKMMECGMDDYIVKPIDATVMYRMLRKVIPEEKIRG